MNPAVDLVLDIIGGATIAAGVFLIAVATVGLLRLGDTYLRMNAVTKAASLGVVFVLAGVALLAPSWPAVMKLLLAIALQLITAPVGGFALGRGAYLAGAPLSEATAYDELGQAVERAGGQPPVTSSPRRGPRNRDRGRS